MAEETPISPLSRLKKRANEEARSEGLDLLHFLIDPNYDPGGPHTVQAVFLPTPEWEAKPEEDPEFEAFRKAQEQYEREERAKEARSQLESLADNLRNPKDGLGLDDD